MLAEGEESGQRCKRIASTLSYFPSSRSWVKPAGNFMEGVMGWMERVEGAFWAWERREEVT